VLAAIATYDEAWNEPDADARRVLLEDALTDDCELIDPNGRYVGRAAVLERIAGFADRFPGAEVKICTNIDAHHGFARYGWQIFDADRNIVLAGNDVVESTADGRLRRIIMFFGALSAAPDVVR
jgi:hypothetical protein